MAIGRLRTGNAIDVPQHSVRWFRTTAIGIAILFAIYVVWAWARNFWVPNVTDYLSFWAAGAMTLDGHPAGAFDIAKHRRVEFTVTPFNGFLPFPYPPPFLLLVTPFSALPYHWGFAGWVLFTGAIYVLASRRIAPLHYTLSHPAVLTNGMLGQTGFLVSGILVAGSTMLRERPFLGGVILGTMIIKPHLALVLPVAVIAARLWPAVAGAAISATALVLAALVLLGPTTFEAFFGITSVYTNMMQESKWPWSRLASPFAFLRYFGVEQGIALAAHAAVAAGAAAMTWVAWSRDWDEKVAVLATASLLIAPYLHTYDSLLLAVPFAYLVVKRQQLVVASAVWLLCAISVSNLLKIYYGPNTISFASIICLFALAWPHLRAEREPNVDHAYGV